MSKIFAFVFMAVFAASSLYAGEVKEAACKAACMKSRDKCVSEASGSRMKEMACDQAYKKCEKDCEKDAEKEKGKKK
ncbi:MAG TPA: hypothetical protein VLM75_09130 [Spirochaetota bacterium]|nr:hypothetical protein [Spirochaetota bacterium]